MRTRRVLVCRVPVERGRCWCWGFLPFAHTDNQSTIDVRDDSSLVCELRAIAPRLSTSAEFTLESSSFHATATMQVFQGL